MFKVLAYLDQWEDVFISEDASQKLRAFRGDAAIQNGVSDDIAIVELARRTSDHLGRPRLLQLFAPVDPPWLAPLVAEHIQRCADRSIKSLVESSSRAKAVSDIEAIVVACREIDRRIPRQKAPQPIRQDDNSRQSKVPLSIAIVALVAAAMLWVEVRPVAKLKVSVEGLADRVANLEEQMKHMQEVATANNAALRQWFTNALAEWQRTNALGEVVTPTQRAGGGPSPKRDDNGANEPADANVKGNE